MNINLLQAARSTNNEEVVRILEKNIAKIPNDLQAVSKEQLLRIRKEGVPIFILKVGEQLFFSQVNSYFNTSGILGNVHQCSVNSITCARVSAASDANGGCQKVRDIGKSKRIEKYGFILLGYEFANVKNDCLVVGVCKHFTEAKQQKFSVKEKAERKLGLASYASNEKIYTAYERRFKKIKK